MDETTIVLPAGESAAVVDAEAVQAASSATIAAEAADAAIAASNAASAMAEVAAAESIAEVRGDVAEVKSDVENQKENFKWLVDSVETCFAQLEALTAENLEMKEILRLQSETIEAIVQSTPKSPESLSQVDSAIPEVPVTEVPEENRTPEPSAVQSPAQSVQQLKRRHRAL